MKDLEKAVIEAAIDCVHTFDQVHKDRQAIETGIGVKCNAGDWHRIQREFALHYADSYAANTKMFEAVMALEEARKEGGK